MCISCHNTPSFVTMKSVTLYQRSNFSKDSHFSQLVKSVPRHRLVPVRLAINFTITITATVVVVVVVVVVVSLSYSNYTRRTTVDIRRAGAGTFAGGRLMTTQLPSQFIGNHIVPTCRLVPAADGSRWFLHRLYCD